MIFDRGKFITSVLAVVVAGSLTGEPAFGDWLVTSDGLSVETSGAWQLKGKLVVFHSKSGVLSSLRLSEIDLEASEAQTEAAKREIRAPRQEPTKPAPKPKARFVVTDADVGHVDPNDFSAIADASDEVNGEGGAPTAEPTEEAARQAAAEPSAEAIENSLEPSTQEAATELGAPKGELSGGEENPLEVLVWDAVLKAGGPGVEITGTLRNPSDTMATGTRLTVAVVDFNRVVIGERTAKLAKTSIGPAQQVTFRVLFPGVFAVSDARFEISSFNAVARKSS